MRALPRSLGVILMRGMSMHIKRDGGMTIVEVLVAFVILFIIMTAVLGLVGQTIGMGSQAVAMNVGTNAVNSYVEHARAMPFSDVFSIETTTVVTDDYTVTIEPMVAPGSSDSLADMYLTITVRRGGEVVKTFETMVVIRDRDQHLTDAMRSPTTDPRVFFQSPTPPDGAVLYYDSDTGTSHWIDPATGQDHPLVEIGLRTQLFEDRTLDVVKVQTLNLQLLKNMIGDLAFWDEPDPTWTILPVPFSWDLNAVDASGTPLVPNDGEIGIEAYVKDSTGAESANPRRYYIVDNEAPPEIGFGAPDLADHPDRFWRDPAGSGGGTLKWLLTLDGITPSHHYEVQLRRQGTLDSATSPATWPIVGSVETGDLSLVVPYDEPYRFARLFASVRAESIREQWTGDESILDFSGPWRELGTSFFTRPTLAGSTYLVDRKNANTWYITPTLTTNVPQFPYVSASLTYEWHQVAQVYSSSTKVWSLQDTVLKTTTTNTYTHTSRLSVATGHPPAYYVIARVTPLGEVTPITIRSDTVTAIATDPGSDGTLTFTEGTW